MIPAASFVEPARSLGYIQYAGVPCSFLTPFINYVIDDLALDYVGAASEGEAVAFSLGAYLAGRKTVSMCQNSGLGNMVNPLTSLNYPFRVPTLLISTWRGQPGIPDEPQHEQMGRIMHGMLDLLEIPWRPFPSRIEDVSAVLQEADEAMETHQRPFALVMAKDSVASHELKTVPRPERLTARVQTLDSVSPSQRMTRTEALSLLLDVFPGGEAIVATTGKTGRELFTIADRPNHLYVVGGMGTASAIGLGIAHVLPDQPVVVIDGDGAALMKLGTLATVGCYQPGNFLHIILDNEQHDSTGGQRTASSVTAFHEIAAAANYRNVCRAECREDVVRCAADLRRVPGPSLLHIKIRPGSPKELGRPTVKPHEVKERFMHFLRR